jgi:hypothetical protein
VSPEALRDLARQLAPMVLEEIAKLATKATTPTVYTTRKGEGPTGYGERDWKRLAKQIGTPCGKRWYRVSAERLAAHEACCKATPEPAPTHAPASWADEARASVGIRTSRGAR